MGTRRRPATRELETGERSRTGSREGRAGGGVERGRWDQRWRAGRFAEFLERLHAVVVAFARPMTPDAWAVAIAEAADELTAAPGRDAWQRLQLARLLDEVVDEGTRNGAVTPILLTLAEIRAL